MESKDKIMLQCFEGVKCKQDFTTGIWCIPYYLLGKIRCGYMWPNEQQTKIPIQRLPDGFPRKGNMDLFFHSDMVNRLLKTNG